MARATFIGRGRSLYFILFKVETFKRAIYDNY